MWYRGGMAAMAAKAKIMACVSAACVMARQMAKHQRISAAKMAAWQPGVSAWQSAYQLSSEMALAYGVAKAINGGRRNGGVARMAWQWAAWHLNGNSVAESNNKQRNERKLAK